MHMYRGGSEEFLIHAAGGYITTYSDIAGHLSFTPPKPAALHCLRAIPGFQQSSFESIIRDYLQCIDGCNSGVVYEFLASATPRDRKVPGRADMQHPSFRPKTLYEAATGSDRILRMNPEVTVSLAAALEW